MRRPAIGERWAVNGITYAVTALDDSGAQLSEVSRDASVNEAIGAQLAALHPAIAELTLLRECKEPRAMRVERPWFERSDVRRMS